MEVKLRAIDQKLIDDCIYLDASYAVMEFLRICSLEQLLEFFKITHERFLKESKKGGDVK